MSVAHSPFRLTPQEDWIFGVKMRGSTLSFGPSGSEVAIASLVGVVTVGLGSLMAITSSSESSIGEYPVKNPTAMLILGVLMAGYGVVCLASSLLVGVRADADGVLVRCLWRRRRLPWDWIAAVRTHETMPHRWRLSLGPDVFKLRIRPVASWSVGVIELLDGTIVRIRGFESAARDEGLLLGEPTATELKVQALSRYKAYVTNRSAVVRTTVPARIEDDGPSPWAIVWYLTGCLAVWLLTSWAAGTLINPALLIVGILISIYQFTQHQRNG